jgi:hypothetical protein
MKIIKVSSVSENPVINQGCNPGSEAYFKENS